MSESDFPIYFWLLLEEDVSTYDVSFYWFHNYEIKRKDRFRLEVVTAEPMVERWDFSPS